MYCVKCGNQLPDNAAFCNNCGARQGAQQRPAQQQYAQQRPAQQQYAQQRPAQQQYAQQRPAQQQYAQQRPAQQQYAQQRPAQQQYAQQRPAQQPVQQRPVQPPVQQAYKPAQPKENVLKGILGALLGGLIGGAVIILFSRLGVVAAASGIILAFATVLLYQKFAGKFSVKGALISLPVIAVTPYLADRLDWAIVVVNEMGFNLLYAFMEIPNLINRGIINRSMYEENLGQIYLYVVIGVVIALFSTLRNLKKSK